MTTGHQPALVLGGGHGGGDDDGLDLRETSISSSVCRCRYNLDYFPFYLRKKVKLVNYFREYILEADGGSGVDMEEAPGAAAPAAGARAGAGAAVESGTIMAAVPEPIGAVVVSAAGAPAAVPWGCGG